MIADKCSDPLPSREFGPPFFPSDALGVGRLASLPERVSVMPVLLLLF
jgi:hypothetical protein